MPTMRSLFSFEQFEEVLQKLAHKIAIDAVTKLQGDVRIVVHGARLSQVETDKYTINFYAKHAAYHEKSKTWADSWGFDVEEKVYLTSNHSTKISFYAPEDKSKEITEKITKFIDEIMAEASIKPLPRFTLSQSTGGQSYLDLMNKAGSKPA